MEYFLNYGGVIILAFLAYFVVLWSVPLAAAETKKESFIFVLLAHLFIGLVIWAAYGLAFGGRN